MNIEERPSKRSKTDGEEKIHKLKKTSEAFISILEKILTSSSKMGNLRNKLEETTERLLKEFEKEVAKATEDAGVFLCNLDDRKHDEETVKNVIGAFPTALRYQTGGDERYVPVQALLKDSSVGYSFVPLLASEGRRLKMFSEEEKGGLASNHSPDTFAFKEILQYHLDSDGSRILCKRLNIDRPTYRNRLHDENDAEFQALVAATNDEHDEKSAENLLKLFELGILEKNDIVDCEMIFHSAAKDSKKRFDFLVRQWPEGLRMPDAENNLPIYLDAENQNADSFGILLKAGLKYYPRQLGFLFHKHPESGKAAIDFAMEDEEMKERLFKWIHEVIPPSKERPILHDVIRLAPKYVSLFLKNYPNATYLRDRQGRLPLHIALQKACKWSHLLVAMISINNPIDRHEKDPVTGLYPFMSAASGRGDLETTYFLLRRDPNAWEGFRV